MGTSLLCPETDAPNAMPKQIQPLTDTRIRKAKPADKSYRLADGKGLYLEMMPNGPRYWRMKYRFAVKTTYSDLSIARVPLTCGASVI